MQGVRRWVGISIVTLAGAAIAAWIVVLRPTPDARALLALLPPDGDAYAVIDLVRLQSNPAVKRLLADPPNLAPTADYQQLLRQTGFHYQDDLKQLALARLGDQWVGAAIVNVDRNRLTSYLESQGAAKSRQGDRTIFSFGTVRPFRLAFLDDQLVAFAIGADPALLAAVLDRHSHSAPGPDARNFGAGEPRAQFPAGSGFWFFGRMDRLLAANPEGVRIGAFQFGQEWLAGSKTLLAVIQSGPLHLDIHVEDQCESASSASRTAAGFQTILAVLRAMPPRQNSSGDPDYTPLLEALRINQAGEVVVMDWHWDLRMLALLERGRQQAGRPDGGSR